MTLTESAYWAKKLGVLGAGLLGIFIISTVVVLNWPGRDPLPTYLTPDFQCTPTAEDFAIHKLEIDSLQLASGSEPIYTINTQTGKLDEIPLMANVYKYANKGATLNSQNEAKNIAKRLGFEPDNIQRTSTEYYWTEDEFGRSLRIDQKNLNFTMETDFTNSTALPEEGSLPTTQEAQSTASSFLRSNGWLLEDYTEEEPLTVDIKVEPNGSFSEAKSRSEADLIRVDFYRNKAFLNVRSDLNGATEIQNQLEQDYQDYNTDIRVVDTEDGKVDLYEFNTFVVHEDTQKSNISVYVGIDDKRKQNEDGHSEIYGIDNVEWVLETEECGTYPLISATELTTKIETGEASLVYLNEKNGDTVVPYTPQRVSNFTINQVFLGYLDKEDEQEYLQPIYVVRGEAKLATGISGDFYYYVPAIDYENLQDPTFESTVLDLIE